MLLLIFMLIVLGVALLLCFCGAGPWLNEARISMDGTVVETTTTCGPVKG